MSELSSLLNATDNLLAERGKTHGVFADQSRIAQALKDIARCAPNWALLSPAQREGLDMDAVKTARILTGDPNAKDHWDDKAGYARLVSKEIGYAKL